MVVVFSTDAVATELFGIKLSGASIDQLRQAAKQAGASLIREGGEREWFDVYDSRKLLPDSSRLYLGYTKKSRKLAFVEYQFNGLQQPGMLRKLRLKYGAVKPEKGKFISDLVYRWKLDDVEILLSSDWQNYRSNLSYVITPVMLMLRQEQAGLGLEDQTPEQSFY